MKSKTSLALGLSTLILGLCMAGSAIAQAFPSKPIRLIVPYAPGGSSDQIARLVAVPMSKSLGVPVVVENLAGGNTMIGAGAAARAVPDGHTLMVNGVAFSVNVLVTKSPSYQTDDFIPVASLIKFPYVLSVNTTVPATNVAELVAFAKKEPNNVNAVSLGTGGVTHLLNERFASAVGVPITSVPYRGSAPALTDLLAGQVQFYIDATVSSIQHIRAGKLRPLAVTTDERSALLPNVPTFKELGYPGMTQEGFFGVFAPKGTPQAVVDRVNAEVIKALASPEAVALFERDGLKAPAYTPKQFADFIKKDGAVWAETIKPLKIQLD